MHNPFHDAESSSPVRVSSPDPHMFPYGTSSTEHSPESSRKPQEMFNLDFSGRIDEEPPDTVEDESGDIGPVEILLPDEKEALENKLPDLSGDSLESPQESHLPETGQNNEQGERVERVADVPVVGAEEQLVQTDESSSLNDSSEKPTDLQTLEYAQDHLHKHEQSEELGEPPPSQGEEGERLLQEEEEEKEEEEQEEEEEEEEEEKEEEEEEEEVGEKEQAQGVGGGKGSGPQQQGQLDDSGPEKEDEDEERYFCCTLSGDNSICIGHLKMMVSVTI